MACARVSRSGLTTGTNFFVAGGTVEQFATFLVTSPEFNQTQTNGSNDSWLNAFYQDALGRSVDAAGQAAWDQAFAAGVTRAQVATESAPALPTLWKPPNVT